MGLSLLLTLIISRIGAALCGVIIEKVAYKPLRNSPRITLLITAIGISLLLENGMKLAVGSSPKAFPKLLSTEVIKLGRFGKFYACSNFPDCRHTQAIVKEIGVECPDCHQGQIIERKTKRNRIFYGCNRYPECEFTSWDKPIGRDCPKCGHYLVEKKVRGGGKQVVCSNGDYEEEKVK